MSPSAGSLLPHAGALAALLLLTATGCRAAGDREPEPPALPLTVTDSGFATPESVLFDSAAGVYLVSNINGSPLEADHNGFISRVSPNGEVESLKWIDGAAEATRLDAPKGMAISGEVLYVTDITVVRRFDRSTGASLGEIPVPGSGFLNDAAAGADGSVYLTDSGLRGGAAGFEPSGTDAVYRIDPSGGLDTLARGDELGRPNGIAVVDGAVWVVSFGSGELYRLDNGVKTDVVALPQGSLDGVVRWGDDFLISSWDAQAIYRGPAGGPFIEIASGIEAPADIGLDPGRQRVLIPLFMANELRLIPIR